MHSGLELDSNLVQNHTNPNHTQTDVEKEPPANKPFRVKRSYKIIHCVGCRV